MPYPGEPVPIPSDPSTSPFAIAADTLRGVDASVRAAWWRAAWDELFAALANRCRRPIVAVYDEWALSLIARMGDAWTLGWARGFNPTAGQDAWINAEIERIREDYQLIANGQRLIAFADSTPSRDEKSARLAYSESSADAWLKRHLCGGCLGRRYGQ